MGEWSIMRSAAGKLTIDLGAVRANYRLLQDRVDAGVTVSAVVKANAYGLGAEVIAAELMTQGCTHFFVANMEEAVTLRKSLGGSFSDITILILNGFYESGSDLYVTHDLIPVLGSFMEIEGYKNLGLKHGRALPAYLHFNTRMNRLGLGSIETKELLGNMAMLDGIDVQCIMSHMACADEDGHAMNTTQYDVFQNIAAVFPDTPKALANSSAMFRSNTYCFDMVRPGMALYGLNPTPELDNPMQAVVSLTAPIIRTRIVHAGAHVGYGASWTAKDDTPLATVPVGYADGVRWSLSNQGAFYWRGIRCPIRGRVSMDMTTVDLSAVPPDQRPKPGDHLEVIGAHQTAAEFGRDAGSFDYEVLTSLSHRYDRTYINPSSASAVVA